MKMLPPFSQVPLRPEQLEHGLAASSNEEVPSVPITMIAADPADLESRWGIRFDDSFDNLDYVKVAVVQLQDGRWLTLLLHRGSPVPGIELCAVDASPASYDAAQTLVTMLSPHEIIWWRPRRKALHIPKSALYCSEQC
jgi:hypothetical protein